eukprot:763778-Hanusia_phi.AAC.16
MKSLFSESFLYFPIHYSFLPVRNYTHDNEPRAWGDPSLSLQDSELVDCETLVPKIDRSKLVFANFNSLYKIDPETAEESCTESEKALDRQEFLEVVESRPERH